jgi:hypothetical protein
MGREDEEWRWPSPASWTVPARAYEYRTLAFHFADPRLPRILRPPIQVLDRPSCVN